MILPQVVDTPGFGDSNGNDNQYIEEMMEVLDNKLGYANTILLVLEGSVPRFSNSLYAMLRQRTSIFGETWWDFMMIGVSKVSLLSDYRTEVRFVIFSGPINKGI